MHLYSDPEGDLQVNTACSVRRHQNSCNTTHTVLSLTVLETVFIREVNLRMSPKLGREPVTSSVAGECVGNSAIVN